MTQAWMNTTLTAEKRAEALLQTLTLGQKIAQLHAVTLMGDPESCMKDYHDGASELLIVSQETDPAKIAEQNKAYIDAVMARTGGIPPVIHTEAISGMVALAATSFPTALGLAGSFDPEAVEAMGEVIRKQMRAVGVRRALSPVMDVSRDPRWGRMGETYGEDATLAAAMGCAFVKGVQTDDLRRGAACTGKHFLGYAMGEGGYNSGTNSISPRDLREVYAKPFQAAITECGLQSIMNSYGAPDHELAAASRAILTDLLRGEMGFDGVVVSDYGAVALQKAKGTAENNAEAAARALCAGLNIEDPQPECYPALTEALDAGLVSMETIDHAVKEVLTVKFRLGLFETPYPDNTLLEEAYHNPANDELTLRLARESTILLKNNGVLPLAKDTPRIAVIGPRADSIRMQFGGYTVPAGVEMSMGSMLAGMGISMGGEADATYPGSNVKVESPMLATILQRMMPLNTPTVVDAVTQKCTGTVTFCHGCDIAGNDRSGFDEAAELAQRSDAVILCVGGKYGWGAPCTSGEGRDTSDIGLPGVQEELLRLLCETGTPVIVAHGDTRPLSSLYAKEHAAAVIETWCPGQSGAAALADVIFGDYNPAGRLPVTVLEHAGQIPMCHAQLRGNLLSLDQENDGFNSFSNGIQRPLWHFGEGQSYTTFRYDHFNCTEAAAPDGIITASVEVTNTGSRAGEEVVQLYVTDVKARMIRPIQELAGFKRVALKAGETKRVTFRMKVSQLSFLDENMDWLVEKGDIEMKVGRSSIDFEGKAVCTITDSMVIDGKTRGFFADTEVSEPQ